jgi:hypothetical protein
MSAAAPNETASEVVDAPAKGAALAPLEPMRKIEAGLAALREEARPFDLTTAAGDKAARAFRARCVSLRTAIDDAYESVNRPLLTLQRDARTLREEIKAGVRILEEPVDRAIKEVEAAREVERIRKAEAEANRIAALNARIDEIKAIAARAVGKPSAEIEQKIQLVVGMTIDDRFQELKAAAEQAQAATLATLRELYAAALVQEDDARRLAEERAALEIRQAAQAEADRLERERIAAEQRAAQARIDAQRAALEKQEREARERQEQADREARQRREEEDRRAAEARELADREARERRAAEEQRLDSERAALRLEQEERDRKEREATEARERAEREAREAEERAQREAAEAEERRQAEARAEQRRLEEAAAMRALVAVARADGPSDAAVSAAMKQADDAIALAVDTVPPPPPAPAKKRAAKAGA